MRDWKESKSKFYRQDVRVYMGDGYINFSPKSMRQIRNGSFQSYDEYLEIQKNSLGKQRLYFALVYEDDNSADYKAQVERVDLKRQKILFKRVMVSGMYHDGNGFTGKEDHVWMDLDGFESYQKGDCISFDADVYPYMRHGKEKLIDYALRDPRKIRSISAYEVPSDEKLIDQQIRQLVCETCLYTDHCYQVTGVCIANETEREYRVQLLKDFMPGKFTIWTVFLAYEISYRCLFANGFMGDFQKAKEEGVDDIIRKMIEICIAEPAYFYGSLDDVIERILYPEYPRIYIE